MNICAIATEFDGIVFRSRTEAYFYEYIKLTYNPEVLEYEPAHFVGNTDYIPDFIVSGQDFHFCVEVKAKIEFAQWAKYRVWMDEFSAIEWVSVMTPSSCKRLLRSGRIMEERFNETTYKQAYNNIKHYISE